MVREREKQRTVKKSTLKLIILVDSEKNQQAEKPSSGTTVRMHPPRGSQMDCEQQETSSNHRRMKLSAH